jgi:hypothetical protein
MADRQSYRVQPGDRLNLINDGPTVSRSKVVTAYGTETLSVLHPGARLKVTVGTSAVSVYILDMGENYTGLRLVRPVAT